MVYQIGGAPNKQSVSLGILTEVEIELKFVKAIFRSSYSFVKAILKGIGRER